MSVTNNFEASKFCEKILNTILDFQISRQSGETVFAPTKIENVRKIAAASIYSRKKKNYGVIGGSSAGVAGGVMTMLGGALIPFTFGTSTLLITSGIAIGLAGAGTSIRFSAVKNSDDEKNQEKIEPTLQEVIDFNELVAKLTVTIHALLAFIRTKINERETSIELTEDQKGRIHDIETAVDELYKEERGDKNIFEKISKADTCVGIVQKQMIELLKNRISVDEITDFVNITNQKRENAFDHFIKSNPELAQNDNNKITFRDFVRQYLAVDISDPSKEGKNIPTGKTAIGKAVAGGGAVAARTAVRVVNVTDNIATVGGTVAKVAKGVSVASVMLSTVGIVIDIAFLGHAMYDLLKVTEMENRQGAKTKDSVKIEPNDFAHLLLEVADIMQRINEIFCWA